MVCKWMMVFSAVFSLSMPCSGFTHPHISSFRRATINFYRPSDNAARKSTDAVLSAVDSVQEHTHVHFGTGKLGIGLIIGSLDEGDKNYILIQRSNSSWESTCREGVITFQVNGRSVAEGIKVMRTMEDVEKFFTQIGRKKGLALTSNGDMLLAICERASSFSVSLGSAIKTIVPTLSRLPMRSEGERPTLYACENNHALSKEVGKLLAKQTKLVCCMVDRICTERDFSLGVVNVLAEDTFGGSLVLLDRDVEDDPKIPFGGATVLLPKDDEESHYFYDRKVSLVNGMHTCLAFMTLREAKTNEEDHKLITYASASEKLRAELRAWAAVRCLMLLEDYGAELIKSAHNVETDDEVIDCLLDYSWEALNRFSNVSDTTNRVLGGGVGNRWATRLWPVNTFAKYKLIDPDSLGGKLLKKAGVTPEFAKECCEGLIQDGIQSCAEEMHDCARRLVDYYKKDNQASFPNRKSHASDFPKPERLLL